MWQKSGSDFSNIPKIGKFFQCGNTDKIQSQVFFYRDALEEGGFYLGQRIEKKHDSYCT